MDNKTAEMIARKAKALKHCDKVLTSIDRYGSTRLRLNCTGVEFEVKKGDAIYLTIQATKYNLLNEIGSYNIVRGRSAGAAPFTNLFSPNQPACSTDLILRLFNTVKYL